MMEILTVGIPGPSGGTGATGATGATGGSATYTAGQALGGHRIVVLNGGQAVYADHADLSHADKVLGITTGAAELGAPVTVQHADAITEPSWNWALNAAVFLGLQGQLTQTPPASGFVQAIGFPLSATTLQIRIEPAVRL